MGLYDRDYSREKFNSSFTNAPQMRMSFPQLSPVVKWLIIINASVFLVSIMIKPLGAFIYQWFQFDPSSPALALQLWRPITYQFLHDPRQIFHILFNMLGLFFLGPTSAILGQQAVFNFLSRLRCSRSDSLSVARRSKISAASPYDRCFRLDTRDVGSLCDTVSSFRRFYPSVPRTNKGRRSRFHRFLFYANHNEGQ